MEETQELFARDASGPRGPDRFSCVRLSDLDSDHRVDFVCLEGDDPRSGKDEAARDGTARGAHDRQNVVKGSKDYLHDFHPRR